MTLLYPGERIHFAIGVVLSLIIWTALIVGTLGLVLLWIPLLFVVYLFAQSAFISHLRGSAVEIGPQQLPELHARIEAASRKLGLAKVPHAYLLHSDGAFNALATRFLGRDYLVLFSSVLDALEDAPGAIDFYIGHEMGHIHRKHLQWRPFLAPSSVWAVQGAGLSRAQEYTCDRYGLAACGSVEDARIALAALAAGHSQRKHLNLAAFTQQMRHSSGFWMSYHEWVGDYPWLSKRLESIEALAEGRPEKHPSRSGLALLLALFTPRIGVGGSASSLIVLIAMVGILAAIAIPAYQDYIARAAVTQALSAAYPAQTAIADHYEKQGEWPLDLAALGVADSFTLPRGRSASLNLVDGGVLQVVFEGAPLDGGGLVLSPEAAEGEGVRWHCHGEALKPTLLPAACRE